MAVEAEVVVEGAAEAGVAAVAAVAAEAQAVRKWFIA